MADLINVAFSQNDLTSAQANTVIRRVKYFWWAVLLSFIGVLAAALIGEIALRLTGLVEPHLITYDSDRGWCLLPGARGWQKDEGKAFIEVNSFGLRGPNYPPAKGQGVYRIAVLGDSFTEAQQVPYGDTFCAVIERVLKSCKALTGKKIEVLDFGVDSYGTAQEWITLRKHALKFSPDLVVVAVFTGNDIRNNSVVLEGDKCRPFFEESEGKLVPVGPFFQSKLFRLSCMARFLSRYSQVLNLLGNVKGRLRELRTKFHSDIDHAKTTSPSQPSGHELGVNDQIYLSPRDEVWKRAWRTTEAELAAIARDAKKQGVKVLVVTLSSAIQVYPDPAVSEAYARELGVADLFAPERRLSAAARRDGYSELNLAPLMAGFARDHHVYLHGFKNTALGWGHWNELGHCVAGSLIAQRICEELGSEMGNLADECLSYAKPYYAEK